MAYAPYYPYNYAPQAPYAPQGAMYQTQAQTPIQSAPTPPAQTQGAQGLSPASRLVTSREEAVGVPADFGGALMVFPDITHNRVYVKRWNMQTGAADFTEFSPTAPEPVETVPPVQYARIEDIQDIRDHVEELHEEIARLKNKGKAVKRSEPDE